MLADAFGKHPSVFSDFFIRVVEAGEMSGTLDTALKRVGVQLEKLGKLRKLSVFKTAITDVGLRSVEKLATLEIFTFGGSKITEQGANELQKVLPKIKFTEQT